MKLLEKKIILITGGSGLLGNAFVDEIKNNGGTPINADINHDTDLANGQVFMDITDRDSIQSALDLVIKQYRSIHGLVNNAYPRTDDWGLHFEDINGHSWKKNVDYQLNSCFEVCQAYCKHLVENERKGSIINVASIYGIVGPDFSVYADTPMTMPAAYSAIKGGIINFTRYLASYYGHRGIRVNAVSPGGIFNNQPEKFVTQYEKKVPLKRMGQPEDIAPGVCFLLSDKSSYITGQNLVIDGGWTSI